MTEIIPSEITKDIQHAYVKLMREHGLSNDELKAKFPGFISDLRSACLPDVFGSGLTPKEYKSQLKRMHDNSYKLRGDLNSITPLDHLGMVISHDKFSDQLLERIYDDLTVIMEVVEIEQNREHTPGAKGHKDDKALVNSIAEMVFKHTGQYPKLKHRREPDEYYGPFLDLLLETLPSLPTTDKSYKWVHRELKKLIKNS